ncbi:hypothetical protein [Lacticigenium naphthae]|uniref:hypothetical protein n=1 Tax=Lacticigenium naphthae TaxID=515351 RepID=UPI0004898138|nr:hypothetical protein [Lacticigenium naphthae]
MKNLNDKGFLLIESYIGLLIVLVISTTFLSFLTFFVTNLFENKEIIEKARMMYDVTLLNNQPISKLKREINDRDYEVTKSDSTIRLINQEGEVEEEIKILYSTFE